jgi:ferrous iron transport protein B
VTQNKTQTVALLGNPNSGKSSLFNYFTGLRQDVSNFPGVTVDKKSAIVHLEDTTLIRLMDLPGTYSVYPNSLEERIVVDILTQHDGPFRPDVVVYLADATQLERHLLFATQIRDMGYPMIFALNMVDIAARKGLKVDPQRISKFLQCPVLPISVREKQGLETLRSEIYGLVSDHKKVKAQQIYKLSHDETQLADQVGQITQNPSQYQNKVIAHHLSWLPQLTKKDRTSIKKVIEESGFVDLKAQVNETMSRFDHIVPLVKQAVTVPKEKETTLTDRIDNVITHRVMGPIIFFGLMFLVFQALYSWASWPMDFIETSFAQVGGYISSILPQTWWSDLIVNGLWAGLGGVLVFVPLIAILFFLISVLEESGYMSRAVFMFDNVMRKFGLNGRSMVALISSAACAIPAIMSTRTISNQRERLLTIMVSPLISCSARLPVYAALIGFVVPDVKIGGIFNAQGLAFMGLYLLGIVGALLSSLLLKPFIKSTTGSFLMMELPNYKPPIWRNIGTTVYEKVSAFIIGAGKVILVISVVLWFLASYGPGNQMNQVEEELKTEWNAQKLTPENADQLIAARRIEVSYIGHLGKWIEPSISPLGFDWKIGIAILTSFAAREVFVGTMATIYSVGDAEDTITLRERMAAEVRADTGEKVYTAATSLSLLIFYVFAMQCMSTLAITKRETNTWKWPIVQFVFMSVLAYVGSWLVYNLMS